MAVATLGRCHGRPGHLSLPGSARGGRPHLDSHLWRRPVAGCGQGTDAETEGGRLHRMRRRARRGEEGSEGGAGPPVRRPREPPGRGGGRGRVAPRGGGPLEPVRPGAGRARRPPAPAGREAGGLPAEHRLRLRGGQSTAQRSSPAGALRIRLAGPPLERRRRGPDVALAAHRDAVHARPVHGGGPGAVRPHEQRSPGYGRILRESVLAAQRRFGRSAARCCPPGRKDFLFAAAFLRQVAVHGVLQAAGVVQFPAIQRHHGRHARRGPP
mmetsp:Transcript_68975/g.183134  ORF Transcript_68975/g.183134 Transcript_68975/m.183134 type:complete len:269 (-) Transcript_68975:1024-1830(-)